MQTRLHREQGSAFFIGNTRSNRVITDSSALPIIHRPPFKHTPRALKEDKRSGKGGTL